MSDNIVNNLENESNKEDLFEFRVDGFRSLSLTFLLLIILSVLISDRGWIFYYGFTAFIFILFPILYTKGFKKIPIIMLKLSTNKLGSILSLIPGISFKGAWIMELDSEKINLKSPKDFIYFIKNHSVDLTLIHIGFLALFIRIYVAIGFIDTSNVADVLDLQELYVAVFAIPFFMAFYFTIIWVWEDAEIKIATFRESSLGGKIELTELRFASDIIRNVLLLFLGFGTISWLLDFQVNLEGYNIDSPEERIYELIYLIGYLYLYTGGITLLMGVMYYRSGAHEILVNNTRRHIRNVLSERFEENPNLDLYSDDIIGVSRTTIDLDYSKIVKKAN